MAAIHEADNADLTSFMIEAEKKAMSQGKPNNKSLRVILDEARADEAVRNSWCQGQEVELIKNTARYALGGLIEYSSQYSIGMEQVEDKFMELVDLCGKPTCPIILCHDRRNNLTISVRHDRYPRA